MRLVFLDTGPLGVLTNPKGTPEAVACQQWVRDLLAAKVRVVVPAIADYELNGIKLSVNPELPCTCDQFRLDIACRISMCSQEFNSEKPPNSGNI